MVTTAEAMMRLLLWSIALYARTLAAREVMIEAYECPGVCWKTCNRCYITIPEVSENRTRQRQEFMGRRSVITLHLNGMVRSECHLSRCVSRSPHPNARNEEH